MFKAKKSDLLRKYNTKVHPKNNNTVIWKQVKTEHIWSNPVEHGKIIYSFGHIF